MQLHLGKFLDIGLFRAEVKPQQVVVYLQNKAKAVERNHKNLTI